MSWGEHEAHKELIMVPFSTNELQTYDAALRETISFLKGMKAAAPSMQIPLGLRKLHELEMRLRTASEAATAQAPPPMSARDSAANH